jgi:hypothetical protein
VHRNRGIDLLSDAPNPSSVDLTRTLSEDDFCFDWSPTFEVVTWQSALRPSVREPARLLLQACGFKLETEFRAFQCLMDGIRRRCAPINLAR